MKPKPYPQYKDSGIEWLGEVPEHWEYKRLKNILTNKVSDGPHETPDFIDEGIPFLSADSIQDGQLVFDNCRYISSEDHERFKIKSTICLNDILMCKAASTGKIARVKTSMEFSVWSPLAIIKANNRIALSAYLEYVLKSSLAQSQIDVLCTSNTQFNISMDDIPKIVMPLPKLIEQKEIATFLDRETSRIDALIQKKERMIELLKEKRIALITQAVTKGLDPNVPMKTSGIEWLGEVPEHWDIAKVGNGFSIQLGKMLQPDQDKDTDVLVPYLKAINVQWDVISVDEETQMWASPDEIGKYGVRRGDLLVCEGGEVGRASMLTDDIGIFIIQNALHRVRSKNNNTEYLKFLLQVAANQSWFDILCNKATIAHFTREKFSDLLIPYPPHEEQAAIVRYLTVILRDTQLLLDRIAESIILLREYRSSLIHHAVTGKIDLRGYDAQAQ